MGEKRGRGRDIGESMEERGKGQIENRRGREGCDRRKLKG